MPKEILLYTDIDRYSSGEFITQMQEAADDDVSIRINADGGDPMFGFGMIAKIQEHKGNVLVKVDGEANSMYAFMLCYATDSEALEVAEFLFHRAAYPEWYENNPECFTDDVRANVQRVNDFLRKAFEAKVDVAEFEKITGVKVKNIFSLDGRIEATLTAAQAKKVGLIDRIVKITPQKTAQIKSLKAQCSGMRMAAKETTTKEKPKNNHKMNLQEFKSKYPKTFAAAVKSGADQEFDRINACLVYVEVDAKGVKEAIKSREPLSATAMAEFSLKAMSDGKLKEVEKDSAASVVTTDTTELTEKEKEVALFEAKTRKALGLK